MHKTLSLFLIILSLSLHTFAQKFSVDFSEKIQSQSGIFKAGAYLKSLPAPDGGVIALFYKAGKRGLFGGGSVSYQVVKFNSSLEIAKEFELDDVNFKQEAFIDFLRIGGHYYYFTQEYNKDDKMLNILATEFDAVSLKSTSPKTVVSWDVSGDRSSRGGLFSSASASAFGVELLLSADSTTFGFIYSPDVKRKETVNVKYIVLDGKLKQLASSEYDFGVAEKKMELNTVLIDNMGKVYFNYDVYDDKDSKSFKRVNGEKVPAYTSHLLVRDGKNNTDIVLDHENHFIKKIALGEDENHNVSVFAFYKNFYRGNYAGVARASMAELQAKKSVAFKFFEFPDEMLALVDHDRQAKDKGDNKGIDTEFEFRTIIANNNGTFNVLMEYDRLQVSSYVTNGQTTYRYRRTFGDIIVATITSDNKVNFARIPKYQVNIYESSGVRIVNLGGRKQIFYSFETAFYKDKVLVFYNDDEDNVTRDLEKRPDDMMRVKQSAFACATINTKGELEKREIVFSHRDMDGYMTSSTFYQIGPGTYALFALNVGMFKYGTKIGKLTIK